MPSANEIRLRKARRKFSYEIDRAIKQADPENAAQAEEGINHLAKSLMEWLAANIAIRECEAVEEEREYLSKQGKVVA